MSTILIVGVLAALLAIYLWKLHRVLRQRDGYRASIREHEAAKAGPVPPGDPTTMSFDERAEYLREALRPEPYRFTCCDSTLTAAHRYTTLVCRCRITCRFPGPMPSNVWAVVEPLSDEDNRRMFERLTADWANERRPS